MRASEQSGWEEDFNIPVFESQENSGLHSDYYQLPEGACELQDLIEAKGMNFSVGNIFKATYRLGSCDHSDKKRDLEKILFFAQRELDRL